PAPTVFALSTNVFPVSAAVCVTVPSVVTAMPAGEVTVDLIAMLPDVTVWNAMPPVVVDTAPPQIRMSPWFFSTRLRAEKLASCSGDALAAAESSIVTADDEFPMNLPAPQQRSA